MIGSTNAVIMTGSSMLEASSEEKMNNLLTLNNIGKVVLYTGENGAYENGRYYKISEIFNESGSFYGFESFFIESEIEETVEVFPVTMEENISIRESIGKIATKNIVVKSVDSSIDPDILPENIKEGVEILGVYGSLSCDSEYATQLDEIDTLLGYTDDLEE